MWLVVITEYDEMLGREWAGVYKAKEGEALSYTIGGMKHVKKIYPFETKKKATMWAREFNENRYEREHR